VDNIVGVINAKDFFALRGKRDKNSLKSILKQPYLVPESVRADVLFSNLKKKREQFAIVLDELGGMEGVVTITDILECIVGDFDEDTLAENDGQPDIVQKGENLWQISGQTPIDEVCEALDVEISDEDFDTFGGYVLSILGEIPEDDTSFTIEDEKNLLITVTSVKEHRIEMTEVQKIAPPAEEEETEK
jgi:putative hemolysin